ncbi:MAG: MFS transporter [Treponema sp.]|jgi:predicted MFS family arabinose efflux permease|nr:MFS transporter [Treponema sp.]
MKKRMTLWLAALFVLLGVFLFYHRERITEKPWEFQEQFDWPNFAGGNGERLVVIDNAEMSVLVLNRERELLYRLDTGRGSRHFLRAQTAVLDEENSLYVYDKRMGGVEETNTERIIKYNSSGQYLGELYSHSYTNTDFILSKGKLCAFSYYDGNIYVLRLNDEGIYLERVPSVMPNKNSAAAPVTLAFTVFPRAFRELGYGHINGRTGRFVITTKTGFIQQYDFSGNLLCSYRAVDGAIPQMAVSSNGGQLVYTDIKNKTLHAIDAATGNSGVLFEKSAGESYYYLDYSTEGICYAAYSDDILIWPEGGEPEILVSYRYSLNRRIFSIALAALLILEVVLGLLFVFCLAAFLKQQLSGTLRRILLVGFSIAFGAGIASILIINEMTGRLNQNTFMELENVSRFTGMTVDAEVINSLHSLEQFDSDEYMALSGRLRNQLGQLSFRGKRIYQFIWVIRDGKVCIAYDMEHSTPLLYPYYDYKGHYTQRVAETGEYVHASDVTASGDWIYACGPLFDRTGSIAGFIETGYDMYMVRRQIRTMVIQIVLIVITAAVAFLLITIELILILAAMKKSRRDKAGEKVLRPELFKAAAAMLVYMYKKNKAPEARTAAFRPELLRAIVFFLFFAGHLADAILPIYSEHLYQPLGMLPREIVITLPFIADTIFAALALLIIPVVLPLAGLKVIGLVSVLLIAAGNVLCFTAANTTHLAAAYALTGFAGGALVLVINTIIGGRKSVAEVNSGFAHFTASYLAGLNVGVVFGSTLAQFFSYRMVYFVSSAAALLLALIMIYFVRAKHLQGLFEASFFRERRKWTLVRFLGRPVVLAVLFLLLFPFMVSQNFVQYFMPRFGIDHGLSESNIGQLILLNGLLAILFGTALCEYAAKKFSSKVVVVFSLLLNLGALYIFTLNMTVPVLIFVVVLLATANIFAGTNIQTFYATLYQGTRTSSVKALSAYSAVENFSMAVGPVVFSYILAGSSLTAGLRIFSAALLASLVLFLFISGIAEKTKALSG